MFDYINHYMTVLQSKKPLYLLIGSFGWKSISFTDPLWPGSLYKILLEVVSQIYTNLSDEPAATLLPSGDQEQRSKFFNEIRIINIVTGHQRDEK